MMAKFVPIAGLVALLLVTGCTKSAVPVASAPGTQVTLLTSLPMPTKSDANGGEMRPFFIGPFDKLSISVFGVAELDREVLTDGRGDFSFPLVGSLQAAGKSTAEVAEIIRSRLDRRYVKRPEVTVNLVQSTSQVFSVDGQVNKAGVYPIVGEATLMRSIAAAGGTSDFAKLDDVLVFRRVEGKQFVGIYNLGAIQRGNYADPLIFANDVIIVGDSPQRRLMKDILQAAPLLTTPIIVLSQQL